MFRGIPAPFRRGFDVLNTTGPGLITRTLVERPHAAAGLTVLFPNPSPRTAAAPGHTETCDVTDTRNWHRFGRYGIHLMEASWRERGNFLWRKAALLWESRTRRRLLVQSRARGLTRSQPAPQLA
jgi:hypothetical protein